MLNTRYSDNTKASVMLLTRSMAMLYKGGPLPVFHWLFRVLALNETRSREQQKFGVLKSLQKVLSNHLYKNGGLD